MTACNAYQTAETAYHVIDAIAGVVEADLPSLQAAGPFSPQEGQVISGYLSLVKRLNDQYGSCVANVQSAMLSTKGKYLACANVFSAGLLDPNELAQLRVISPRAQQKVQLWVTAFQIGLNTTITALGGKTEPPPVVSSVPVAQSDLDELRVRVLRGM